MSDIVSSGNLVNALNSVRDDYHEHLKSIPQYEAFLLIESSTHRVFETLHGLVNSPAPSMAAEVISSLEVAKTKFKEHLTSVPEYRALLAIEKLISDVSIELGVAQPAPAQIVLATVELEMPPEAVSIQPEADLHPEPDLTESTSRQAVLQPEAAEIAANAAGGCNPSRARSCRFRVRGYAGAAGGSGGRLSAADRCTSTRA